MAPRELVTLGMFIVDHFSYADEEGRPTGRTLPPQIGGGGTYATIGARIWLQPSSVGMIVDRGRDWPADIEAQLRAYGNEMWLFRDHDGETTRALNSYKGEQRGFEYLTPRIRLTPKDLAGTPFERPRSLHFICSPSRAAVIMSEGAEIEGWNPTAIYEPIPDRCVPEELPSLIKVMPSLSILSPNAEEALSLLSVPLPPTKAKVAAACTRFLALGVGRNGGGWVIIRSGALGAYAASRAHPGKWVDAFWGVADAARVVDVTGGGNAFLGGLAAGLALTGGDVFESVFYASVSASFIIEQQGLPALTRETRGNGEITERWNGDAPIERVRRLKERHAKGYIAE